MSAVDHSGHSHPAAPFASKLIWSPASRALRAARQAFWSSLLRRSRSFPARCLGLAKSGGIRVARGLARRLDSVVRASASSGRPSHISSAIFCVRRKATLRLHANSGFRLTGELKGSIVTPHDGRLSRPGHHRPSTRISYGNPSLALLGRHHINIARHIGHLLAPALGAPHFSASCSDMVSLRSNCFPHFSQRYL